MTKFFDPGVLILDDSSPVPTNPAGFDGRGRDESQRPTMEAAATFTGNIGPFPDSMRIPVKDMKDLIAERRAKQIGGRWVRKGQQVSVLDQNGTNFCWANGPTQALKITRALAGMENKLLSAAAVAAQINHYRNNGGMGINAFKWIAEKGVPTVDKWPVNYYASSKYVTPDMEAEALLYRGLEYYTFASRDIEAVWSSLILNMIGAAGLNWWGHEVCYCDIAWDDKAGKPMIDFDNSWGTGYGTDGQAYLQGSKAIPDDYQCWRVANAA